MAGAAAVLPESSARAVLPQAGDLVMGHSDFDEPETLELVRGSRIANGGESQGNPWEMSTVVDSPIQSVEFDNLNGIAHNGNGNLLALDFGNSTNGGLIYSLPTVGSDPLPAGQLIGDTLDLDFGPSRLGGLSISPDNTKIAVTGYDSQRVIVYDYTAGDTMGGGASLTNGRESEALLEPTDTQGSAWLDNDTVLAFHSAGDLYEIDATSMAHTLVKDLDSPILGGEFTSLAYNPEISPYIYASKSSFAQSISTNTLFILDPNDDYNLVKQLDVSTSLGNTARETALDQDGNLFISVFGGEVDIILDVVSDPASLSDDSPIVWFESEVPSGFNGIDVGLGEAVEGVLGDYNNNGTVDAADYVLWRKGGPLANEGDEPGVVNQADYEFWRSRFGAMSGAAAFQSAAVPEPTSAMLQLVGLLSVGVIGRYRRYS